MKKMVVIEVTVKRKYVFEEGLINGWTAKEVMKDWFEDFDINRHHATRDFHHLQGGDVVINFKEVKA